MYKIDLIKDTWPPFEKKQEPKAFSVAAKLYFRKLFPIVQWLPRYNTSYFLGDFIAGITVGVLAIPEVNIY